MLFFIRIKNRILKGILNVWKNSNFESFVIIYLFFFQKKKNKNIIIYKIWYLKKVKII